MFIRLIHQLHTCMVYRVEVAHGQMYVTPFSCMISECYNQLLSIFLIVPC